MLILMVIVAAASTLWSYVAFPDYAPFTMHSIDIITASLNMLIGLYKLVLPSVCWSVALFYLCDFFMATIRKSSDFMIEFYKGIRADILFLIPLAAILVIIYRVTPYEFTSTTIEVGMAAVSFVFYANIAILKMFNFRIGRLSFSRRFTVFFIIANVTASIYFISWIVDIADGHYSFTQSLWMQITVLSFAISLFVGNKLLAFYMKKGRIEPSPLLIAIVEKLPSKYHFLRQTIYLTSELNKEIERERAISSRAKRKQHKKRKNK